ncbi:MAG: glycosyltransferase [Candidatus Saccharibacteria bacterium]|nr:glycosyltransferase [Candidatus Saccharibacteria bacterium]
MKICMIAPVVLPLLGDNQKYGGIEVVVSVLAEELTRKGHDVIVFASGDSKIKANVVPVVPNALGIGTNFKKEKEYNRLAYEMAVSEKPDVIWDNTLAVHGYVKQPSKQRLPFLPTNSFRLTRVINTDGIPVIHTIHSPAKRYWPRVVHKLSKAGHYFVTISRDQARGYKKYIKSGQHLGTIYNPVDLDFFKPAKVKKGDFLLWLGRFSVEKGAHIALAAAQKIDIPIILVGKMMDKYEIKYFKKFIQPYLGPNDRFIENGTTRMNADLFKNAKAFLMTNLWKEPFGMVVAQSMASGTPVIGPSLGSLTELIGNSGKLVKVKDLFISENAKSITRSQKIYINRVADAIKSVDSISSKAPRQRAEELFSSKKIANSYEKAFQEAVYLNSMVKTKQLMKKYGQKDKRSQIGITDTI